MLSKAGLLIIAAYPDFYFEVMNCLKFLNLAYICVRIREPYVYQEIVVRKRKNKKVKDPYSQDSFSSFLNSANNIEYVLLILTGINQFLEDDISQKINV